MILTLPDAPIDQYIVIAYRVDQSHAVPEIHALRYIYYKNTPWDQHPWGGSAGLKGAPFIDDWTVEVRYRANREFIASGRITGWRELEGYLSEPEIFATAKAAQQSAINLIDRQIIQYEQEIEQLKVARESFMFWESLGADGDSPA